MSYEVIARKWRPRGFDEVVGQDHVTTPLRNAIRSDRVPHAILLTGPRGVGKTTIARILARALNCEKGPTDSPCGSCTACEEITAGRSTDVQEIDAASRTSVDDVRELIEAIRYAPSPGKHRIYVVDEVHMLSTAAFNALLKTLEEPPPRSLFVFATTNPEKIPFTVVSRCQRYDLRRIAAGDIVGRLKLICADEKIAISDASLLAIAREADGSLRDSQTLLDQVVAYGGTQVEDAQVVQVLDLVDRRLLMALAAACVDGDAAAALTSLSQAAQTGGDAKRLSGSLLELLRDLLVLRIAPETEGLVEAADAELAELRALAERADPTRLRRMFRALVREQEDLAWAPRPMAVLEMAVVRLATLPEAEDVARLIARLEALEGRLSSGGGGSSDDGSDGSARRGGAAKARPPGRAPRSDAAPPEPPADARPANAPVSSAPAVSGEADVAREASPPPPSGAPPEPGAPLGIVFDRLRAFVARRNAPLASALDGGRLLERQPGSLRLAAPSGFAAQRLESRRQALEALCAEFFGEATAVQVQAPEEAGDAGPGHGSDPEQVRRLRQRAIDHPSISLAVEVLGGEIAEIRSIPTGGAGSGGPR